MPDGDVPLSEVRLSEAEVALVAAVYREGWLSQGPRVAEFERAFASMVGVEGAVAVSSGTSALHLGLVVLGVRAGDEVVLPSLTFAATAATVTQLGARPVFADIASPTAPWLSAQAAAAAITPRTRAIINVAYAGDGGELQTLAHLCAERGIELLEDAAHAVGARTAGAAVGTIGAAGAFSFYANKQLTLGEGGMLVCRDRPRLERARRLRTHGLTSGTWERHTQAGGPMYDIDEPGFNYRLDEARAALGTQLLGRAEADRMRRGACACRYDRALRSGEDAVPVLDASREGCGWYIYPVVLAEGVDRDSVRMRMARDGIQTSVHYPPLHRTRAFAPFAAGAHLPHTERYARRTLTLPLFPGLTEAQQERVLGSLRRAVDAARQAPSGARA